MSSKRELAEGGGEVAVRGAQDLLEALFDAAGKGASGGLEYFVPGIKALVAAWDQYHASRAEKYLRGLADLLGFDDGEMTARKLSDHVGKKHFDQRVVQGFRLILESWDELAHECITMLVADSLRARLGNRDYQLAGKLLAECDEVMLGHLERITRMYVSVLEDAATDQPDRIVVDVDSSIPVPADKRRVWVIAKNCDDQRRAAVVAPSELCGPGLDAALNALQRHDFGSDPGQTLTRVSGEQTGNALLLLSRERHDHRMKALHLYLQPVRAKTGKL